MSKHDTPRDGDAERLAKEIAPPSHCGSDIWRRIAEETRSRDAALREARAEIERLTAALDAAGPDGWRPSLFVNGEFTAHSGDKLPFKIDCDALTDADLDTLAAEMARRFARFRSVHGVPRGGLRLASALDRYATGSSLHPPLIVDDVLTTGASMERYRSVLGRHSIGAVIFARGLCSDWISPLFSMPSPPAPREGEGGV